MIFVPTPRPYAIPNHRQESIFKCWPDGLSHGHHKRGSHAYSIVLEAQFLKIYRIVDVPAIKDQFFLQ